MLNVFQLSARLPDGEASFKSHKNAFLNDLTAKKRDFLDSGLVDQLDIAYYDRTMCFSTFGNTFRS